jgi:hypothetical protein
MNIQDQPMDWFERITGFREKNYDDTRAKLVVEGGQLRSLINGKSYRIGELELLPLHVLRERARSTGGLSGRLKVRVWAAVQNAQRGASNIVLLTFLGGGAFGNEDRWVHGAIQRALELMSGFNLDVRLVSYGAPSKAVLRAPRRKSQPIVGNANTTVGSMTKCDDKMV